MSDSTKTAEYSPMPRRDVLRSLAALAVLPCPPPPSGPDRPDAPASAILELSSHGHWRITHDGTGWSAEPVPRWEVPEIAAAEQPLPVLTELSEWPGQTMLMRWWDPADVPKCGLCDTCGAWDCYKKPGLKICVRMVPDDLSEADAPLYRMGEPVEMNPNHAADSFL